MGEPLPPLVLGLGLLTLLAAAWLLTALLWDGPYITAPSAPPEPPAEWLRGLYDDLR